MESTGLALTVSPEVYEALSEEAKKAKKSPEDLSVEILTTFLMRQRRLTEGRRLLRTMPRRAAKRGRQPQRTNTARQHDDCL